MQQNWDRAVAYTVLCFAVIGLITVIKWIWQAI